MTTRCSLLGSVACFSAVTVLLLISPSSSALVPHRHLLRSTYEKRGVTLPHQFTSTSTFFRNIEFAPTPHKLHKQDSSPTADDGASSKKVFRKAIKKHTKKPYQNRSYSHQKRRFHESDRHHNLSPMQGINVGALANTSALTDTVNTAVNTTVNAASSAITSVASTVSSIIYSGQGTYYATGLGACGETSTDSSMIAAASHLLFDSYSGASANSNNNPICGRKLKATYQGKSVEVSIVDRCTGCAMYDLDFSPAAFKELASLDVGRLSGMTWSYTE